MIASLRARVRAHFPIESPQTDRRRLARLITEILAPAPIAAILILAITLHSAASRTAGIRWAAITLLFGCAFPYAFVRLQVHRGRLTDHHVRLRRQRPLPLLVALLSILLGLGLLVWFGAPRAILALIAAMAIGAIICSLVTLFWKMSIHTGTVVATALILSLVFGPALLPTLVLAVAVGWARVELNVHTVAQVVGGGIIGGVVAPVVFFLLR
jgi:hypothetical protein